ncbi:hypothetical protein K2X92_00930 [Candidatus Gracilibacteria bacterium]|nr:hypothetical protein [Candidatus Gracilibacteria bacterium]
MKKYIFAIFIFIGGCVSVWGFLTFGTGIGFKQYIQEAEYRRLHPEFLPSPIIVKTFDMGHSSSYASFLWIEFIQYLSDNLKENHYLTFSNAILKQITDLNPYFIRPYEINLILSPFGNTENIDPEKKIKNQMYSENSILLGKKGMEILCDKQKIEAIKKRPITDDLQSDPGIKNPCASGSLPYYMGFIIQQMGTNKVEASEYYKIASAQDNAPGASKILGILALSSEGDYMASALNFGLIAVNGYDNSPFTCRSLSENIILDIGSKRILDNGWIGELEKAEKDINTNQYGNSPLANATDNCPEMIQKSIKQIYLAYIAERASGTNFTTGEELVKSKLIPLIPTISSQKNYTVYLKDGTWQYRPIIQ